MSRKSHALDLHPIYNQGDKIDAALENALEEAEKANARELEIICDKGSGQLKKRPFASLTTKIFGNDTTV